MLWSFKIKNELSLHNVYLNKNMELRQKIYLKQTAELLSKKYKNT